MKGICKIQEVYVLSLSFLRMTLSTIWLLADRNESGQEEILMEKRESIRSSKLAVRTHTSGITGKIKWVFKTSTKMDRNKKTNG